MNIRISQKTEEVLHAAIRSGQFASIEEFIDSMARRWQSEQKTLPVFQDRIDIDELTANKPSFSPTYKAPIGLWPEDESVEEFIKFVREERAESRGTNT